MNFKLILGLVVLIFSSITYAQSEEHTARYFDSIKSDQSKLEAFLRDFPKGGDLHSHESGASLSENLIKYAANDNLCINKTTYAAFVNPQCQKEDLLETAVLDSGFYNQLIDQWSMRHFNANTAHQTGHDHFFATFGKFGAVTHNHRGNILAEISQRAADQNELYLELMDTPDGKEAAMLGKQIGWQADFATMRAKLLAAEFAKIAADGSKNLNADEAAMRSILACDSSQPQSGCQVKIRYLYQVLREQPPEAVFAQLLMGFEMATKDKRIVGLNMVQPEDGVVSMRDYKLQMQMIGYLRQFYPSVSVSLHAGELNAALVPAEGLTFHVNDAVNVAKADRIGHGVDVMHETNADALLKTMAQKHVMVEINLTSNAGILNIVGKEHPLLAYLQYGVPVALSTDDEGVTRSNLTHEYVRAVKTYQFSYQVLKQFSRNSLRYAFLPGASLWVDENYKQINPACAKDKIGAQISTSCTEFLKQNEKAALQWALENKFAAFESHY